MLEKKEVGRPEGDNKKPDKMSGFSETAEKVAKETGVTSRTIHRDAQLAEAVEELTQDIPKEILKQNPNRMLLHYIRNHVKSEGVRRQDKTKTYLTYF